MTEKAAVLEIGTWNSRCRTCNTDALPEEETHTGRCGYGQHAGCGVRFTHVTTSYVGMPSLEEAARKMRPDLIYIDPMSEANR